MNLKLLKKLSSSQKLLILFGSLIVLGQFQRISVQGLPNFYLHEVLGVVLVVLTMLNSSGFRDHLRTNIQKMLNPLLVRVLLGWILLGVMRHFYLSGFDIRMVLYFGRISLTLLIGLSFYHRIKVEKSTGVSTLRNILIIAGTFLAGVGLLQRVFLPDTRFLAVLGWDDHLFRLISTWFDPGFTGLALLLTLLLVLSKKVPYSLFLVFLLTASIVLTYSRATFLAAGITIPIHLLQKHSFSPKKLLLGLSIAGLLALSFITLSNPYGEGVNLLRTRSISARFQTNLMYLEALSPADWMIGKGLLASRSEISTVIPNNANLPDNSIVTILYGTGVVGLLLFIANSTVMTKKYLHLYPEIGLLLTATFVHSQFHASFTHGLSLLLLTLCCTVVIAEKNLVQTK